MDAVLLSFAAVSYLAPLRQAAVPPRATPVARATGVMQQTPGIGAKSMGSVPVSISTTGFNSRCISVRGLPSYGHADAQALFGRSP